LSYFGGDVRTERNPGRSILRQKYQTDLLSYTFSPEMEKLGLYALRFFTTHVFPVFTARWFENPYQRDIPSIVRIGIDVLGSG
jgi:hypothetical protein